MTWSSFPVLVELNGGEQQPLLKPSVDDIFIKSLISGRMNSQSQFFTLIREQGAAQIK